MALVDGVNEACRADGGVDGRGADVGVAGEFAEDTARKAFEKITKKVLPASHTQLQRALSAEAKTYRQRIEAIDRPAAVPHAPTSTRWSTLTSRPETTARRRTSTRMQNRSRRDHAAAPGPRHGARARRSSRAGVRDPHGVSENTSQSELRSSSRTVREHFTPSV